MKPAKKRAARPKREPKTKTPPAEVSAGQEHTSAELEVPPAPSPKAPEQAAPRAPADRKKDDESPIVGADGVVHWRYVAWALGSLAALGGFIWLLMAVQTVSVPFLIAFILAYLLDPAVDRFEERGISRTLAIVIILTAGFVILGLVILLVGPQLVRELSVIPEKLQVLGGQAVPWIEGRFDVSLPRTFAAAATTLQEWLRGFEMTTLTAPTMDVLRTVLGGTAGVLSVVVAILLIPVFAFFLLRDFDRIVEAIRDLVPSRYRPHVVTRFREIDHAMSGFIRGQLSVAGILAVLYTAGLWAVGLPMALMVGVVAGLGNMVPYLGTTVGLVLATLMALLDWQGVVPLLMVYGVFVVVQLLEGWVITPRIVGDSVGLSPFFVIVAVLLFGELFGFVGILIAVPLAAILKILLRVLLEQYRASPFFQT